MVAYDVARAARSKASYGRPTAREVARPVVRAGSRAKRATSGGVSGMAIGIVFVGGLLAYAGVKGIGIGDAFRALFAGKSPATVPQSVPVKGASGAGKSPSGPGGAPSGAAPAGTDIMEMVKQAKFSGANADIMYRIVARESGGNALAHHYQNDSTDKEDSYGLTQINMMGAGGAARRLQFGITRNTDLYNPAMNLRAAHILSGGTNFGAWGYGPDAYRQVPLPVASPGLKLSYTKQG